MKIRYSASNEVSIEATKIEMENLKDNICRNLCYSDTTVIIKLNVLYDPKPYDLAIEQLTLGISEKNSIIVKNMRLAILGTKEFWFNFSENLPYDVESLPYHVHYDHISFPQFVSQEAPDLVIETTK